MCVYVCICAYVCSRIYSHCRIALSNVCLFVCDICIGFIVIYRCIRIRLHLCGSEDDDHAGPGDDPRQSPIILIMIIMIIIYIYVHTCVYVYTYIYIYIYTYKHISQ